jgi:hypothetical protein
MKYPPVQIALVILVGLVCWECVAATRASDHGGSVGASTLSSLYSEISEVGSALSEASNAHDLNALMSLHLFRVMGKTKTPKARLTPDGVEQLPPSVLTCVVGSARRSDRTPGPMSPALQVAA